METNYSFSEHQVVLQQQKEMVKEVEKVADKFSEMDIIYSLQTADELWGALTSRFEKLKKHIEEYNQILSQMNLDFIANIQNLCSNFENSVAIIERDKDDNLHCGDCLVSYNYCQDKVGKKVKLSLVSINTNNISRGQYPVFAKHIEVIE